MSKKRVLIVDDDESLLMTLKDALILTGDYIVETVSDSTKAVHAARTFRPDVIVLDVMMPDMDGGQVAAAVWEEEDLKKVPIIFQTAVMSKKEAAARHSSREHYLAKPVPIEELTRKIDELCR